MQRDKETEKDIFEIYNDRLAYFETLETESAPSGEWDEYNINWLQEQATVMGMEEIIDVLGSCEECTWNSKTYQGENTCDLMSIAGMKYCSKFTRKEDV